MKNDPFKPNDLTRRKINWGDGEDDAEGYFVMANGRTIARIFPTTRPDLSKVWQWAIPRAAAGEGWKEQDCRGYELTREGAVEALARAWQGDKRTVVLADDTRPIVVRET